MLGTALDTQGGISAVVNAYRAQGLFRRWSIDYIQTHRDGRAAQKLLTAIRALLRFVLLLARYGHAVIHVHSSSRASFWRKSIFMAIAMLAKCPVIFHLHGGGFAHFYEMECGEVRRRIIRYFLDRAACVIVLSERWRAWMSAITRNPRIVCMPNPAPSGAEQTIQRYRNVVLFLGRLERGKGIFDLLDTICALRGPIPDVRLVCAGDGDLESITRHAEELGIGDVVTFPGWVGPAEKKLWIGRAAVFVLPSYAEGLPMSLLEAMAAGLPVVATAVGGIPDVVIDGVNGFLFSPGDTGKLERLLRRLMQDRQLGQRIARAARETVEHHYSADRVVAQLEQVYTRVGLHPALCGGTDREALAATPADALARFE